MLPAKCEILCMEDPPRKGWRSRRGDTKEEVGEGGHMLVVECEAHPPRELEGGVGGSTENKTVCHGLSFCGAGGAPRGGEEADAGAYC